MNQFERVAIYTTIESIETQLRGLKTLIAASSGVEDQQKKHVTTQTLGGDDGTLTDEEEKILESKLRAARASLANQAQDVFLDTLTQVAGGVPPRVPSEPAGQEMSQLNG